METTEIKYYTDFKNYSKLNADTCSLIGILNKDNDTEVLELLENEEVETTELEEQRPFTENEFKSIKNAWEHFNNLNIVKKIKDIDFAWTNKNIEKLILELNKVQEIELFSHDFIKVHTEGFLDLYYDYSDGENKVTLTITFYNILNVINLSSNINMSINGKKLDFEVSDFNMNKKRVLIIYTK